MSRAASFDDGFHTARTCGRSTGRHQDANWAEALVAHLFAEVHLDTTRPRLYSQLCSTNRGKGSAHSTPGRDLGPSTTVAGQRDRPHFGPRDDPASRGTDSNCPERAEEARSPRAAASESASCRARGDGPDRAGKIGKSDIGRTFVAAPRHPLVALRAGPAGGR